MTRRSAGELAAAAGRRVAKRFMQEQGDGAPMTKERVARPMTMTRALNLIMGTLAKLPDDEHRARVLAAVTAFASRQPTLPGVAT
jgi:hypothetical protein